MADEKITLTCENSDCRKQFKFPTPTKPGTYSVLCPHCKTKNRFKVGNLSAETPKQEEQKSELKSEPKVEPKAEQKQPEQNSEPSEKSRFLEDGNYLLICENASCKCKRIIKADKIKIGHNVFHCPQCLTKHEFEKEPTQDELLQCQTTDCNGKLDNPGRGDGVYSIECHECGAQYKVIVAGNKIIKVQSVTPAPISPAKLIPMKLSIHSFFGKKEYNLTKGTHFVGRLDEGSPSDFMVKDKYASARSLKIEVNQNGENVVYKLTVNKATNPVYHNNRELVEGDIIYLNYGDTLKVGKTLIRVQKI